MSDDPYDRGYQPSCMYLSQQERDDVLNGREPPWRYVAALVLAALSIGMWIGRYLL